ncbi:MAG: prolyl oligopeptidase family serine peptidase [Candidatus Cloacimonetes bacterium]|nr:prolyl oligopeptidase family serine peptidase [Candidatus Cloacimonadota bacterium]
MNKFQLKSYNNFQFYPAQTDSKQLMIVLHGRGDSADGLNWLSSQFKFKNMNYLYLNAPDPWPIPFGAPGYSWYDMAPNQGPGVKRSYIILKEIVDELQTLGFHAKDTFVLGFSQGCLMSLELVLRSNYTFQGLIGISGFVWQEQDLKSAITDDALKTPILITHGYQDEVLDYEHTKQQVDVLQSTHKNIEFRSYSKGHTIVQKELEQIYHWITIQSIKK